MSRKLAPPPKWTRLCAMVGALVLGGTSCVPRPLPPAPPPWAPASYDFRSVTRVGGEVLNVDDVRSTDATFSGVQVLMRADGGAISVQLGPRQFFEDRNASIAAGDRLDVTGFSATYQGKPTIVATSAKKNGRELLLPPRPGP